MLSLDFAEPGTGVAAGDAGAAVVRAGDVPVVVIASNTASAAFILILRGGTRRGPTGATSFTQGHQRRPTKSRAQSYYPRFATLP